MINDLLPCRHPIEYELDRLVENSRRLVKLQLCLQFVVLPLHVHDHRIEKLDLKILVFDAFLRGFDSVQTALDLSKPIQSFFSPNVFALIESSGLM